MNIIVTTHGNLAEGLLQSYNMIYGENKYIHTIKLSDEGIGKYKEDLHDLINELSLNGEVLILCDIVGGTPYNECLMYGLQNPEKISLVSGVNLPMLLEIGHLIENDNNIISFANIAKNAGQEAITIADLEL